MQDPLGPTNETPKGIIQTFARYCNVKYAPIEVDASAIEEMAENDPKDYPEHLRRTIRATNKPGGHTHSSTKRRAQ